MTKELEKELDKKIEKKEAHIYIDKDVCRICGETPELLTLFSIITDHMYSLEGVDDEVVELAFKLGHATVEEQLKIMKENLEKIIEKIDIKEE